MNICFISYPDNTILKVMPYLHGYPLPVRKERLTIDKNEILYEVVFRKWSFEKWSAEVGYYNNIHIYIKPFYKKLQ